MKTMTIIFNEEMLGDVHKPFVTFKCDEMPIPFWQMVLGEIERQLTDMRQANATIALRNKMIEDARNQAIADMLAGKGNPTSKFGPG